MSKLKPLTQEEKNLYLKDKGDDLVYDFDDEKQQLHGRGASTGRLLLVVSYETVRLSVQRLLDALD